MSFQPTFPGLFSSSQGAKPVQSAQSGTPNLPATEKQIAYATTLAARAGQKLPEGITSDRAALSKWIDAHKAPAPQGRFSNYPSSKQVAFAERIATLKRNPVPPECFRDKGMMSRWIDSNKPR
ncbi:hypothetical protein OS190_16015 [Sulfitobacter sp. F26204]|uniref:hypothetical protein n=1 Tax=Sulfitobacter sp. F26204 TaxID=2996014 RepID=UPI00225E6EF2|nr:hypothetical protein [Sulfitobacter sp. F26204]MCX7561076.1 hypothetical protein [Sulfitobacter sp. F26204]